MSIFVDPTRTHLNKRISTLPALGATVRVRVGDELVTGKVQGIADLLDRDCNVTETCVRVLLDRGGNAVVGLDEVV